MRKVETDAERAERIVRQNKEREEELKRVPFQPVDKSEWPKSIRPIAFAEADGLGIDATVGCIGMAAPWRWSEAGSTSHEKATSLVIG